MVVESDSLLLIWAYSHPIPFQESQANLLNFTFFSFSDKNLLVLVEKRDGYQGSQSIQI